MMSAVADIKFWRKKRVFLTGHTGFKGTWLSLWLHALDADVTGYSLHPPTKPNLFELTRCGLLMKSIIGDVRDTKALSQAISQAQPEIIIHMAAQPLVRASYKDPVETYFINVMGTIHVLEAVRQTRGIKAFVNVTTDKCYENREWVWAYREDDRIGGHDAYSTSKACAELVTTSYRRSFFSTQNFRDHGVGLASARAGNVIGGGDWATDRLIPDCIRAFLEGQKVIVRNPGSTRPWQHVLDPLAGYLLLAQKLYQEGPAYAEGWNFGPADDDMRSVEWIVKKLCESWEKGAAYTVDQQVDQLHEAMLLKLDCSKARVKLGWRPRWNIETAIDKVVQWTQGFKEGQDPRDLCLQQIEEYVHDKK